MEITIQENSQYGLVVSSRIIAKELEKRHAHVIRDIENIFNSQNPNLGSTQNSTADISALFIKSEYKASNGKRNKEYLLTKDGFTLYMFNIQGYQDFKMAYIQKFNEMEKIISQQVVQGENTLLLKEIERLREIEKQYNNIPMSWAALECVKDQINETIDRRCKTLGKTNKIFKKYLYMELEKEIFEKFGINNLQDLKEKDYQTVMPYIFYWIESYSLRNKYIITK